MASNRMGIPTAIVLLAITAGGCGREQSDKTPSAIQNRESPRKTDPIAADMPKTDPSATPSSTNEEAVGADTTENDSTDISNKDQPRVVSEEVSPAQLRSEIRRMLGQGQDQRALQLVRKLMRVSADHPESVFLHALVLGKRQRYHEAVRILDQLAEESPETRLPALGQTAQWLVDAGQFDEAESRYRALLNAVPDASLAHRFLAQLLIQTGKRTQAATHLSFLGRQGQLNQEELRLLLAISTPLKQETLSPRTKPLTRLANARSEIASGDFETAISLLESDTAETDPQIEALRARVNATREQFDQVESWASTREVFDGDADGWFAMGCLAASQEEHAQSIEYFCRALLIDQTDAEAYEGLSRSAKAIDKPDVADEASRRATLIRQTQVIGEELSNDIGQNRKLISKLIPLLQNLSRPIEVLGWKNVDLVFAATEGTMTDSQAEKAFAEIAHQREQMIIAGLVTTDRSFVLCGLKDFPLDEGKK